MADTVYQLSDVVKRYRKGHGEVLALRGVDLVIRDGEWLAIQGPTGHGKSTLLQILGGLDRPTSGTVEFDGVDLARLPETRVTRERARSIGFVFQTFNLIPTLSAAENVEVALVPLGFPASERRMRAEEGLSAVGLGDRLRHLPSELHECRVNAVPATWLGHPCRTKGRSDDVNAASTRMRLVQMVRMARGTLDHGPAARRRSGIMDVSCSMS
jgi:ABC-type lipoprotein export system ATPase subunit